MIDSFISCECTGGQHPSLDKPMLAIRTLRLNSRNDRTLTTLARAHLWLGSPILDPHYWSTHEGSVVLDVSTAAAAVEKLQV